MSLGRNALGTTDLAGIRPSGGLEVSIADPVLPFGPLHAEKITPQFQFDGVYGYNETSMVLNTREDQ